MNKRILYKNKIIRKFEEDIWGSFYKKQQRRDLFIKKILYVAYLSKFSRKKNNFRYNLKLKYIFINYLKIIPRLLYLARNKINAPLSNDTPRNRWLNWRNRVKYSILLDKRSDKRRYIFGKLKKDWRNNKKKYIKNLKLKRFYLKKQGILKDGTWLLVNNSLTNNKNLKKVKKKIKKKELKKNKLNLKKNKNDSNINFYFLYFVKYLYKLIFNKYNLCNSKQLKINKNNFLNCCYIIQSFFRKYNTWSAILQEIKKYFFYLNIQVKFSDIKKFVFIFFYFYKNKKIYIKKINELYFNNYKILSLYILKIIKKRPIKKFENLKKEKKRKKKKKKKKYLKQNIKTKNFIYIYNNNKNIKKVIPFYFLYLNKLFQLVTNFLTFKKYAFILNQKKFLNIFKSNYYKKRKKIIFNYRSFFYLKINLKWKKLYLTHILNKKKKIIKLNKIFNNIFSIFNFKTKLYYLLIFFKLFLNIKLNKKLINILNLFLNKKKKLFNLKNFLNLYLWNVFLYFKKNKNYIFTIKKILFFYYEYHKWSTRKFAQLRLYDFSFYKKKNIFFLLHGIFKFRNWLERRLHRFMYTVRNFYYYKYNNFEDKDSIHAGKYFDIRKINLNFIKTDKDRKNNFILLKALENLKNNNNSNKYIKNFKKIQYIITKPNLNFNKTEYLLSFYASNKIYKFFRKLKVYYIKNILNKRRIFLKKEPENRITYKNYFLLYKYSKYVNALLNNINKKERFYSIKKRKTALQRMFTLNLVPIVKYVKKKPIFNSFYKYKILKVWKIRKFYGCLTNYEFKRICYKALKYKGDTLIQFLILLESRLDTLLYRTGMVSSIFEARQIINHSIVFVNDKIIDKRSYTLRSHDILSLDLKLLTKFVNNCIHRINTENILFRTPIYLEVNYKLYMVIFLFNLIKINNISYNFNLKSAELNSILYYYY